MMSHYHVNVAGREYEVRLTHDGDSYQVNVNGRESLVMSHALGESRSVILIDKHVHEIDIRPNSEPENKILFIQGMEIPVRIESYSISQLRKSMGDSGRESSHGTLVAPMPGMIVSVNVKNGERVESGQPLVIIEAMKMENVIKARSAGLIKSVSVSSGQSIEKGASLIEFE